MKKTFNIILILLGIYVISLIGIKNIISSIPIIIIAKLIYAIFQWAWIKDEKYLYLKKCIRLLNISMYIVLGIMILYAFIKDFSFCASIISQIVLFFLFITIFAFIFSTIETKLKRK